MGPSIKELIACILSDADDLKTLVAGDNLQPGLDNLLNKIEQKFVSPRDYAEVRDTINEMKQHLAAISEWLDKSEQNYFRKQK